MSRRNREQAGHEGPAIDRSTLLSPGTMRFLTLCGVAVLVFMVATSWSDSFRFQSQMNARLIQLDTRLTQLSSKIDTGARAAAQPRRGPDPNRVYTIRAEGAPYRGPKSAAVTIVEFSDFQCPFCARAEPTLEQIRKVYADKVRIVWKHYPLEFHKDAPLASLAALAADDQGKFWPYHDKLFASQPSIQHDFLLQYARDLGLDMKRFEASLNAAAGKPVIDSDVADAKALGVTGTPAFFINGHFLSGAKPFAEFAQLINGELTRLNLPIPAGAAGAAPAPGGR